MARRPSLAMELSYQGPVAGVDEAGRGPLAGPVVAAAVIFTSSKRINGIRDSKQLTREQREDVYARICERSHFGVGMANVEEIDRLNILWASMLAMERAVAALAQAPRVALVDGNCKPKLPCQTITIVEGDAKCLSIAAASIVAKVTRDRLMCALAEMHPGYGWEHNAGYGTGLHQEAIRRLGLTPHHRRSFGPVRAHEEQLLLALA